MVIKDIGITPDIVASFIGFCFPCLMLLKDSAISLAASNENKQLRATCQDRYKIARNPTRYRDLLNGVSEEKDGFVLANVRPHLVIDSTTNFDCFPLPSNAAKKLGLYVDTLVYWVSFLFKDDFAQVPFAAEMEESLHEVFLKNQIIPKLEMLELEYIRQ